MLNGIDYAPISLPLLKPLFTANGALYSNAVTFSRRTARVREREREKMCAHYFMKRLTIQDFPTIAPPISHNCLQSLLEDEAKKKKNQESLK